MRVAAVERDGVGHLAVHFGATKVTSYSARGELMELGHASQAALPQSHPRARRAPRAVAYQCDALSNVSGAILEPQTSKNTRVWHLLAQQAKAWTLVILSPWPSLSPAGLYLKTPVLAGLPNSSVWSHRSQRAWGAATLEHGSRGPARSRTRPCSDPQSHPSCCSSPQGHPSPLAAATRQPAAPALPPQPHRSRHSWPPGDSPCMAPGSSARRQG